MTHSKYLRIVGLSGIENGSQYNAILSKKQIFIQKQSMPVFNLFSGAIKID